MSTAPTDPTPGHLVLIGAMGCGKTTVGRLVANALRRDLVDNDAVLLRLTGATARELSSRDGLAAAHRAEMATFQEMLRHPSPAVVTVAASVVDHLHPDALDGHTVIYLRCSPEVGRYRARNGTHRPAIALTAAQIERRDDNSRALANLVVDTSATDAATAASTILTFVSDHGSS